MLNGLARIFKALLLKAGLSYSRATWSSNGQIPWGQNVLEFARHPLPGVTYEHNGAPPLGLGIISFSFPFLTFCTLHLGSDLYCSLCGDHSID